MPTQPLLVEIRCEELPPAQVHALAAEFPRQLLAALRQANFATADSVLMCGDDGSPLQLATPRRFAALIDGVLGDSVRTTVCRRGPLLSACYDAEKAPTRALQGFMQAVGAESADALTQVEEKGKTYIAFDEVRGGEALGAALAGIVEGVLRATTAPRLMRWGDHDFKFIRPLRGVLLMHGGAVLNGEVLGIAAAAHSQGHPALAAGAVDIPRRGRLCARVGGARRGAGGHSAAAGDDSRATERYGRPPCPAGGNDGALRAAGRVCRHSGRCVFATAGVLRGGVHDYPPTRLPRGG